MGIGESRSQAKAREDAKNGKVQDSKGPQPNVNDVPDGKGGWRPARYSPPARA